MIQRSKYFLTLISFDKTGTNNDYIKGDLKVSVKTDSESPIGVFDSGVGGISVLRELVKIMPNEDYLYLGIQ